MKWIIWVVAGTLATLWTGALALAAALVGWTADAIAGVGTSPVVFDLPPELPVWLSVWVDPAAWGALVGATHQALQWLPSVLPIAETVTGWLVPLVWVLWALGMLALLLLAAGSHGWVAQRGPRAGLPV